MFSSLYTIKVNSYDATSGIYHFVAVSVSILTYSQPQFFINFAITFPLNQAYGPLRYEMKSPFLKLAKYFSYLDIKTKASTIFSETFMKLISF